MPQFIGLDLHKTVIEVCVVDAHGTVCARQRFPLTRATLTTWAQHLTAEDAVAVEATTNTWVTPVVNSGRHELQPHAAGC